MRAVESGQRQRQARGGRALHRAQAQPPAGLLAAQALRGLFGQGQQLVGIALQLLSLGCQHHAPGFAYKKRDAQRLLQLLDTGGDIGLGAAQLLRSTGDAAAGNDLLKNGEGGEIQHGGIYLF